MNHCRSYRAEPSESVPVSSPNGAAIFEPGASPLACRPIVRFTGPTYPRRAGRLLGMGGLSTATPIATDYASCLPEHRPTSISALAADSRGVPIRPVCEHGHVSVHR